MTFFGDARFELAFSGELVFFGDILGYRRLVPALALDRFEGRAIKEPPF